MREKTRVTILLAAMGFFLFLGGGCTAKPEHSTREALLDRASLQDALYENPYGSPPPPPRAVNWIEATPENGPQIHGDVAQDHSEEHKAGLCTSVEYAPEGPVTAADRKLLQQTMADVKEDLLKWVESHRIKFATSTYETLRNQIRRLQLGQPGPSEDPDLGDRGIGVWTQNEHGPIVRLGPGFVTLLKKDPERGRFELLRLAAQGWAPCELLKLGAPEPWSAYLRCMGIQESETGCGPGDYSEAGWAVSSAVASVLAKPARVGCTLPAFSDQTHAECPKNFLLPLRLGGEKISLGSIQRSSQ